MKYLLLFLFFFTFSLLPFISEQSFGASGGLTIEPVFQDITLTGEGETVSFEITLTNDSVTTLTIRPSVVDFGSLDESGGVAFLGEAEALSRKYALASWMRPEKDVLTLASGESEKVRIDIENRDSLSPGGHYGAVLLRLSDEEPGRPTENTVAIGQAASVLVFVKKEGGTIATLELKETDWERGLFHAGKQVRLRLENSGNIHLVPRGILTLTDPLGRVVKKDSLNESSYRILPETQRTYVEKLQSRAIFFVPGRYTLSILYRYDGREDFLEERIQSFIFPWPSALGITLSLFLLSFFVRYSKKASLKRKNKEEL